MELVFFPAQRTEVLDGIPAGPFLTVDDNEWVLAYWSGKCWHNAVGELLIPSLLALLPVPAEGLPVRGG